MLPRRKSQVSRRRVFYIPGYDPHPPRRYRELYRSESQIQAAISDYRIEQKSDPRDTGWRTRAEADGARTFTKFDVLVWHDLVRGSMRAGIAGTYYALIRTAWIYLSTGTFRRLSWLAKGPVIAALYPIVMLLGQLLLALAVASGLSGLAVAAMYWLGGIALDWIDRDVQVGSWVWGLAGGAVFWGLFLPMLLGTLRWFKSKDDRT